MANSPSHRFGQIIGDLLEEIIAPQLAQFCNERGLFLDKKGERKGVRKGKKVSWIDKYGNSHELDFVIEKGGTPYQRGRPLAFIETAWRRYTKHSRNKAQEIQGAILPIAEKYDWDKPFLGVILAGFFTNGSLTQMKTSGFDVALFPYESIVNAFASVQINVSFDEQTPDAEFQRMIRQIEALMPAQRESLKNHLVAQNQQLLAQFFMKLQTTLDRQIERIILIPLHGHTNEFKTVEDALRFVQTYQENSNGSGPFSRYEVIVRYSNDDKVEASFTTKERAIEFLNYIAQQ